jgi:hypothetical protein
MSDRANGASLAVMRRLGMRFYRDVRYPLAKASNTPSCAAIPGPSRNRRCSRWPDETCLFRPRLVLAHAPRLATALATRALASYFGRRKCCDL